MSSEASAATPSGSPPPPGVPRRLFVAFALLLLALLAGGVAFHEIERGRLRATAENELAIIGRLKVDEIAAWRAERLGDASVLMENRFLGEGVVEHLSSPQPDMESRMSSLFRSLRHHDGYEDVLLADTAGRVRWSLSGTTGRLHDPAAAAFSRALATHRAVLSDLHSVPGWLPPHVDVIAPLFAGDPALSEPVAAIVLRADAQRFLFPRLAAWPRPSQSAETLLVRRDGADVLYLNELRHRKGTALALRVPLTSTDAPAVKAMRGRTGIVAGPDYRGVPVLAALTPVPDSPWIVVAKVDTAEALAASRSQALVIGGLLGLLATTTFVGFLALWQRASKSHYKRLYEAETGLVESEARYRSLFEHMTAGVARCRMIFEDGQPRDFVYLDVNRAFGALTGLKDAVGRRVSELIPGIRESNPELFAIYGRVASGGPPEAFETYVAPLDIWFQVSVYRPAAGQFVAVFENISQRKTAEGALRESEEQLRTMFELAAIGIAQADPATGRWLRVNQKMCDITGYSAQELLALRIPEITHPADRQADREAFQRVVRGELPAYRMEKRYLRKDGGEVWVNVNVTVIRDAAGRPVRSMATIEDISDRKRAEQALSESEAFTRAVLDNLPVGIAVNSVDPTVTFSYVNDNFLRFYRTTRERLTGPDAFWEAAYEDPGLRERVKQRVLDDCASGDLARMHWEEIPISRRGEETTFVSARNIPVPGKPFMISTVWDVTERKRSQVERDRLDVQRQLALDAARLGWWHYDPLTRIASWDDRYKEIFGVSGYQRANEEILARLHPDDLPRVWAAVEQALDPARPETYAAEYRIRLPDGSERWVKAHGVATFEGLGDQRHATSLVGTVEDVTERKQAEQALQRAHERLRRFVDSNVVGVVIADDAGGIHEANDYYLRLVGFSRDELLRGQVDWRALTPPEWLPADERALRELHERGTCTPYEKEYLRRDGTRVPVLLADALLPGPEREIAAFALDLTELKQAERALRESEERYRTVAEFTHDWEYWRAPDGKLLYVSPSCERITGYPASAFVEDSDLIDRIVHPDDRALLESHHATATERRDSRLSIDIRIVRRDGSLIWMNHSCLPVFDQDGRALGRRGSNRDITDRRRIEDEIRRLNEELEERVRDRTAQLEVANKELEAFSYSVSHDLRAPLRGIDGWSLALLEDYGDTLDDQARQYLDRIRADAQRMGYLIDDMLKLARVTRAPLAHDVVDLSALADTIVGRLRTASPERLVETVIQPGVTVRGDAALLEVVMTNLLDNAWKFSAPRRPAHIAFGTAGRDGERVFFVRDDGVGFDMAYAGKLFGVFQRMHKASEFPGTGVGLATVQRIVQRHGGRAWVRAEVDGGATFSFTLSEADQ